MLAFGFQCKPKGYRDGPKLQLVKLTKQFLWCPNKFREFVFKGRYTEAVKHGRSVYSPPSAHAPLSYLVPFSSPFSSALVFLLGSSFSIFSFSPPPPPFMSSFRLNKLVPLMSNDTSRFQSQLHDNKMAVTFLPLCHLRESLTALPSLAPV